VASAARGVLVLPGLNERANEGGRSLPCRILGLAPKPKHPEPSASSGSVAGRGPRLETLPGAPRTPPRPRRRREPGVRRRPSPCRASRISRLEIIRRVNPRRGGSAGRRVAYLAPAAARGCPWVTRGAGGTPWWGDGSRLTRGRGTGGVPDGAGSSANEGDGRMGVGEWPRLILGRKPVDSALAEVPRRFPWSHGPSASRSWGFIRALGRFRWESLREAAAGRVPGRAGAGTELLGLARPRTEPGASPLRLCTPSDPRIRGGRRTPARRTPARVSPTAVGLRVGRFLPKRPAESQIRAKNEENPRGVRRSPGRPVTTPR